MPRQGQRTLAPHPHGDPDRPEATENAAARAGHVLRHPSQSGAPSLKPSDYSAPARGCLGPAGGAGSPTLDRVGA